MTIKTKICTSFLLLLFLAQMFDASLFPHTHFSGGKIISIVCAHICDYGDPKECRIQPAEEETCHAQELFLALMSSTVVAPGVSAVDADLPLHFEVPFVITCERYTDHSEVRYTSLRGPPSLV